jgi:hypothetical protein
MRQFNMHRPAPHMSTPKQTAEPAQLFSPHSKSLLTVPSMAALCTSCLTDVGYHRSCN